MVGSTRGVGAGTAAPLQDTSPTAAAPRHGVRERIAGLRERARRLAQATRTLARSARPRQPLPQRAASPAARPAVPAAALDRQLIRAAEIGDASAVDRYLARDADPDAMDRGSTALHRAVGVGSAAVVRSLMAHRADPNLPLASDGRTPLHIAAERVAARPAAMADIIETLMDDVRTDPAILDHAGRTPLALLPPSITRSAFRARADLSSADTDDWSAVDLNRRRARDALTAESFKAQFDRASEGVDRWFETAAALPDPNDPASVVWPEDAAPMVRPLDEPEPQPAAGRIRP